MDALLFGLMLFTAWTIVRGWSRRAVLLLFTAGVLGALLLPWSKGVSLAMALVCLGPLYLLSRERRDHAVGYGMSIAAAVGGMAMSARHLTQHLDSGYLWALVGFLAVIVGCGARIIWRPSQEPSSRVGDSSVHATGGARP